MTEMTDAYLTRDLQRELDGNERPDEYVDIRCVYNKYKDKQLIHLDSIVDRNSSEFTTYRK